MSLRDINLIFNLHPNNKCAYSPYCLLYFSKGADKENLSNSHKLLYLVIISFIPMTLVCDPELISKEKLDASHSKGFKG